MGRNQTQGASIAKVFVIQYANKAILLHLCMDFHGQKSTPYIADILHQHGVEQVVICPGSRNAPLTLAFTRHGKFNCLSMVDERSAGYFALGMAKASQKPVVLICTSGTAPLNFAPAIAEAFHQQVSIIVITADRPEGWIGQQDGQAINQKNLYANIIAKSYHLRGELFSQDELWFTERTMNEAFHISTSQSRPVHINISFSEPLYDDGYALVKARKVDMLNALSFFSYWETVLNGKKNILVLVGQTDQHESIISAANELSIHPNTIIVAENLANIPACYTIFNATEALGYQNDKMKPDVVVYLGGPVVSKQLKKYISSINVPVIRVQLNDEVVDTFQNNETVIRQTIADGLQTLSDYLSGNNHPSDFSTEWKLASDKAKKSRNEYLAQIGFSDLKVFELLARKFPPDAIIHLANSTPVRYAQVVNDIYRDDCTFFSNRGTSGIDGSTSTAAGFSYINKGLHFLVTGDLSFQYDANAFFNEYVKGNFKIIIINNAGGNIFRIIDGPRDIAEREKYFETSVQHEFSNLAKHFKLNYFSAKNELELNAAWIDFVKVNNRPSVLEIFTDAKESADVFKGLYKYLEGKNKI